MPITKRPFAGSLAAMEGDHWDAARIDRMLSFLAPDARYHVYAWEEPHVGRNAIRAEWIRQAPAFRDCQEEIVTIGSVGTTVYTERLDMMTINDQRVALHVAGVLDMDSNGKIALWRDYGDRKEVDTALGLNTTGDTRT